jgi:hypothetical protein
LESKKLFLTSLATYAISHNSEILKNVITINTTIIMIARKIPTALDHDLEKPLNAANASATHTARINICTTLILKGPMLKVIPASKPFLIFFG